MMRSLSARKRGGKTWPKWDEMSEVEKQDLIKKAETCSDSAFLLELLLRQSEIQKIEKKELSELSISAPTILKEIKRVRTIFNDERTSSIAIRWAITLSFRVIIWCLIPALIFPKLNDQQTYLLYVFWISISFICIVFPGPGWTIRWISRLSRIAKNRTLPWLFRHWNDAN